MNIKIDKNYLKLLIVGVVLTAGVFLFFLKNQPVPVDVHLPANLSTYINYSSTTKFLNSKNVLFFKANWCSSCTVADENLTKNNASIPENLTIYKVDYERENSLRLKYGVTVQHTFVQVDSNGNELKKWIGSYTIDEILRELV